MATLKVTVHLWTDEVPEGADCWKFGMVHVPVRTNVQHGVQGSKGVMFNKPEDLPAALARALADAGIVAVMP
jgi:hypothetical protein